jgi:predicted DNA-binding transcriptional regulator AlpA
MRTRKTDSALHAELVFYAPRGLSRDEAARYIGVGTTKFDEMVADGRMPRPKRIDGRVIWDRLKIEAAFSDLPDDATANPLDRMLRAA